MNPILKGALILVVAIVGLILLDSFLGIHEWLANLFPAK